MGIDLLSGSIWFSWLDIGKLMIRNEIRSFCDRDHLDSISANEYIEAADQFRFLESRLEDAMVQAELLCERKRQSDGHLLKIKCLADAPQTYMTFSYALRIHNCKVRSKNTLSYSSTAHETLPLVLSTVRNLHSIASYVMRDQDVGFKKWKCLSNGSKAILNYQKLKKEAQIHMPVFAHSCRNMTDDGFVHRAQDELSASSYHTSLSRCSPGTWVCEMRAWDSFC